MITFLLLLFRFCLKLKTLLTAPSLEKRSPPGAERKTSRLQLFLAFLLAVFPHCDWTVESIAMDTSSSGPSWGNAVKFTSFVRRPTTAKTQKLTCKAKDVFIFIFFTSDTQWSSLSSASCQFYSLKMWSNTSMLSTLLFWKSWAEEVDEAKRRRRPFSEKQEEFWLHSQVIVVMMSPRGHAPSRECCQNVTDGVMTVHQTKTINIRVKKKSENRNC